MSKAKGTVQVWVTCTVPLIKLSSSILERQVQIEKKNVVEKDFKTHQKPAFLNTKENPAIFLFLLIF